jgi:hypothetical protein
VVDTITLNVPLVTRLFEYFLENKMNDEQLHKVLEQLILVSKKGSLTMDNYDEIVSKKESFKEEFWDNLSKKQIIDKLIQINIPKDKLNRMSDDTLVTTYDIAKRQGLIKESFKEDSLSELSIKMKLSKDTFDKDYNTLTSEQKDVINKHYDGMNKSFGKESYKEKLKNLREKFEYTVFDLDGYQLATFDTEDKAKKYISDTSKGRNYTIGKSFIKESYKEKLKNMRESVDSDILNSLEGDDSEEECFDYISGKYPTYDKNKLKQMIHHYKTKMNGSNSVPLYKEKLKNLREYARTIDVDGQKIVAEISGSGNKAFTLDGEDKEYHLINGKWEEVKK